MMNRRVELEADLEALYVERGELRAQRDIIAAKRGYDKMSQEEFKAAYDELDCEDEYESIDYELYIVERAIDEIEHTLYVERLGYDDNNINNIEEDDSMDRCEVLVKRFFDILEEGGEYTEIFLIRDLLMKEYINGALSQVEILQIDDIIEEQVYNVRDGYLDSDNAEYTLNEIYVALAEEEDLDKVFELVNAYGDMEESNVYAYYCVVRELERITGETLVELCI